jgi:hypothetical protein
MIAWQAYRAMVDDAVTVGSDRGSMGIVMARANTHAVVAAGDTQTMPVRC